ncbi:MarR family transcriptional regulator [Nocardioides sp.]|uniref:MarR family winged helix-turn-helix transcriptional regulator n=1 Tax=Nocardioides sp. TaxID=35761 RepID=UPI002639C9A0|nr:MarR family transcriptional regulator [Nocardioides sp.]
MCAAPRPESLVRLEQEVGVLVRRIHRVIAERARLVHPDLQPASYLMLSHVAENGPMRASSVADLFTVDKGAISRQVTHLMELGLVEKSRDPEDGRAWLLSATPDAKERLRTVTEQRRTYLAERLEGWEAGDLELFTDLLARYNDSLGQA